jgi:hypothetical protein
MRTDQIQISRVDTIKWIVKQIRSIVTCSGMEEGRSRDGMFERVPRRGTVRAALI